MLWFRHDAQSIRNPASEKILATVWRALLINIVAMAWWKAQQDDMLAKSRGIVTKFESFGGVTAQQEDHIEDIEKLICKGVVINYERIGWGSEPKWSCSQKFWNLVSPGDERVGLCNRMVVEVDTTTGSSIASHSN